MVVDRVVERVAVQGHPADHRMVQGFAGRPDSRGEPRIGLATARALAAAGSTVPLGARDACRGTASAQALAADGLDARFVQVDVTG